MQQLKLIEVMRILILSEADRESELKSALKNNKEQIDAIWQKIRASNCMSSKTFLDALKNWNGQNPNLRSTLTMLHINLAQWKKAPVPSAVSRANGVDSSNSVSKNFHSDWNENINKAGDIFSIFGGFLETLDKIYKFLKITNP